MRTWKIKFKNSKFIKPIFDKWFNDYKYAYNKSKFITDTSSCNYSDYDLRNLITPESVCSRIPWFLDTPQSIRAAGVFEYKKNLDSAFTNLKNENIKYFNMVFLTKKKCKYRYCFSIPGLAIKVINKKTVKIYPTYTNGYQFKLSKPLSSDAISDDNTLLKEHRIYFNGKDFYLLLCLDDKITDIQNRKKLVAIDPGVRKIVTAWSPGNSYFFGENKTVQIKHLLLKRSIYQKNHDWYNFYKIENRIKNIVSELHHKTSLFLCKRYKNIILPELDVNSLIKKTKSKGYRKAMLRLKIREFNNLLKTKAESYNSNILCNKDGVTEMYSSRMCSNCKYIGKKNSDETKICKKCGLEIDRDISAAKNIYFMNKHLLHD